jgi:hypothetical protein
MSFLEKNEKWIYLLLFGLSTMMAGYAHADGLLLTHDSVQYLSAASSFRHGLGFMGPDGTRYAYWPPLFPMLLSLFASPLVLLPILNVFLSALLLGTLYLLSQELQTSASGRIVSLSFLFLGVHFILLSVFVWSELIFLVLFCLQVYLLLVRVRSTKANNAMLNAMILALGVLLCLQRNAGLFLMVGIAGWLFFLEPKKPLVVRLFTAGIFIAITTSGLWAWNIYNTWQPDSSFRFYAHDYGHYIFHNFSILINSLTRAFLPSPNIFVSYLCVGLIIAGLFKWRQWLSSSALLLLWIIAAYLVGMSLLFELDEHDGDRYVSIVLPFLVLILCRFLEPFFMRYARTNWIAVLVVCAGFIYPVARSVKNASLWHKMSYQIAHPK